MDAGALARDASEILGEISRIAGAGLAPQAMFQALAGAAARACDVDRGSIFLLDASGAIGTPAAAEFADGHVDEAMWTSFSGLAALRVEAFPFLAQAALNETAVVADAQRDPRVPPGWAELFKVKALMSLPLTHQGRTLGVLILDHVDAPRPFTPEQLRLAGHLADHLSLAIANAGLSSELCTRENRLQALLEVNQQLGRLQSVESLFAVVCEACTRLFGSTSVAYRIVEGTELVRVGSWGDAAELGTRKRLRIGESISGRVALTGEPLLAHDLSGDARLVDEHRQAARRLGYKSLLAVPMRSGERITGVLGLWTRRSQGFTVTDVPVALALASQVAISLENARLYGDLAQTNERLHALFEAVRLTTASLSLGELLPQLARTTAELLGADGSSIRLLDAGETRLELAASWGMSAAFADRGVLAVSDVPLSRRALDGEIVVVEVGRTPGYRFPREALAEGYRWGALIPLRSRDRALGHLSVYTRAPRRFDEGKLALCAQFASLAAVAVDNARLYRSAEARAERLTALSTLVQHIAAAGDIDGVFDAVASAAAALLGARLVRVWSDDPARRRLLLRGEFGQTPRDDLDATSVGAIPYGSGLVSEVVEARLQQSVADVQSDPRWLNQAFARRLNLRAWTGVPMIARDEVVGVLSIFFDDGFERSAGQQELMRLLAGHAAIAIENRRAAERLREAKAQTEQLLASISWILIAVDDEDAVTQWNEAAEGNFAVPAATVLGRPFADCGIRWDWRRMLGQITRARGRPDPTRFDQIPYVRADGKDGFLSITLNPLRSSAGPRSGFLLLGADVTERRVLESQRAERQKLESIGQLAAGIAHEINTPIQFVGDNTRFFQTAFDDLQVLLGAYHGLRDEVAAGAATRESAGALARLEREVDLDYLVTEIPKAIGQTLDGITRVATIVRALKEFAHPDQKEKVASDINQALLSTLAVARNEIKYVADVRTELGELPLVVCQPGELNQVFLNLLVNAAHAIADVVGDTGDRGTITVRTAREGDTAVVSIADTGGGIPDGVRNRIFDPFFTTKEVGRGTGQGLTIARSVIVDKHGGTLTFETELGRGTTFFVRLPIAGADGRPTP